jgi:hypothetical protein
MQSIQDAQLARHAFGDAHGDALLLAQREDDVWPPKILGSAELNFLPRNAERRMADAEQEEYRKIEGIFRSFQTDDVPIVHPEPHFHTVEKRTCTPDLSIRLSLHSKAPGQRKPTSHQADHEAYEAPQSHEKDRETVRGVQELT